MNSFTNILVKNIAGVVNKVSKAMDKTLTDENGNKFNSLKDHLDDKGNKINILIRKEANIEKFGASRDPEADNTAAFENAYKAVATNGGTIIIPDGKFNAPKLNIIDPNVRVSGYGTLKNGGLIIGHPTIIKDLNFVVKDITIEYDSITIGNNGIELRNARRGKILNVNFRKVDKAIYTQPVGVFQHCSRVQMENLLIDGANYVLYIDRPNDFNDYTIGDFSLKGSQGFGGINYNHVYGLGVDGLILEGNSFFFPSYSGASPIKGQNVYIDYGNFIIITDNNLFEAGTEAILLNRVQNQNIKGNNIAWPGQRLPSDGIKFTGGNQTGNEFVFSIVADNNIMFPTGSGISLGDNVNDVKVNDNNIRTAGSSQYYYGDPTALATASHFGITTSVNTKRNSITDNNTSNNVNNIQGDNFQDGNLDINNNVIKTTRVQTLNVNASEIDVKGSDRVHLNQPAANTITALTNGYGGQKIRLLAFNGNTTIQRNSSILLRTARNLTLKANESIELTFTSGVWYETGRTVQELPNVQTLSTNDTTIDVSSSDRIHLNQPNATTVTAFNNGSGSQEITLLSFNANTTIQNSASIILKGATNVNIPANGIMKFIYTTGKWLEMFRNF
ncbi:hypothetical protein ACLNAR_26485 [Priestia aryabhattai]|uniref:hypothetical protein n=1 Tax=Priestia aryabhattai TaxID=412384 RepID=UPI00398ED67E